MVSGNDLLNWINAFLINRHQCVITEHCFSEWSPVISGVPQGSVLGPVLFILYIDDIFEVFSGSSVTHKLFADDLKMYSNVKTTCDTASLQAALGRLQQWCTDWQLIINTKKCFVLHLGKNNSHAQYFLYDCPISATQNVTDLGVDIDCNLKFDFHINKIIGKAFTRLGVLLGGLLHDALIYYDGHLIYSSI